MALQDRSAEDVALENQANATIKALQESMKQKLLELDPSLKIEIDDNGWHGGLHITRNNEYLRVVMEKGYRTGYSFSSRGKFTGKVAVKIERQGRNINYPQPNAGFDVSKLTAAVFSELDYRDQRNKHWDAWEKRNKELSQVQAKLQEKFALSWYRSGNVQVSDSRLQLEVFKDLTEDQWTRILTIANE